MSEINDMNSDETNEELKVSSEPGSFFGLKISDDGLEAYITVFKPEHAGEFNYEDIIKFLKENNVVYGILESEIKNIFNQKIFDKPVMVACGKKAVDEKDGEIKYLFDTMIKPFVDDSKNTDYKELNLIQNVEVGDALAEIIPPVTGETGYTVTGKEISFRKGVVPALPMGKNTKPNPENPLVLEAEVEGGVRVNSGKVEVDSIYVIKNNVDYSTGNIFFKGSIVVNGDVKSGFKVKAKNDVQINGVVEDAIIEAGGNVLLKNGFIGKDKGMIIARGNVTLKFCENVTITAEGDIYIGDFALNCTIQTKGRLFATDRKGMVVGGESYAVGGIDLNISGNRSCTPTKLHVGIDMVTNSYLENNIQYLKEIENVLHKLSRRQLVRKALPENIQSMIDGLHRVMKDKEQENKVLMEAVKDMDDSPEVEKNGEIRILKMVYPGTWISIYDKFLEVMEIRKSVCYKYSEEEIIAGNL